MALLFALGVVVGTHVRAQSAESVRVSVDYGPSVTISVREDIRLRENGVYQGLRYRERYGVLKRTEAEALDASRRLADTPSGDTLTGSRYDGRRYEGRLLTLEETMRGTSPAAKRVQQGERVVIALPSDGSIVVPSGQILPRLRLVPSFPDRELQVGDEWSAPGLWVADPSGGGEPFTVLVSVAYRYRGMDAYAGEPVHVFDGGYRLRYPFEVPEKLEPLVASTGLPTRSARVSRAEGSHRLTIMVSADGTRLLLVRDVLTSVFELTDGTQLSEEGFSLMFWRTSAPVENVATIERQVESVADASVDQVEEGVRITLGNLQFRPDSARMLPGEAQRIDAIAAILTQHPRRNVLVVGHTADVGRPEGQMELSISRARAVVDALVTAGVRPARLLFEGRGGTEPRASNATEAGRAENRRVEIILLDDRL